MRMILPAILLIFSSPVFTQKFFDSEMTVVSYAATDSVIVVKLIVSSFSFQEDEVCFLNSAEDFTWCSEMVKISEKIGEEARLEIYELNQHNLDLRILYDNKDRILCFIFSNGDLNFLYYGREMFLDAIKNR